MHFEPLHNRVILKVIQIEQKTQSGLIVAATDDRQSDTVYGKVVAAGPGMPSVSGVVIPSVVKAGDIVLFKPNTALRHQYLSEEYFILRETEIASIVHGVEESQYAELNSDKLVTAVRELESLG